MKFLLAIYICSSLSGTCYISPGYPVIKTDYPTCVLDGLIETHQVLTDNFTYDQILDLKLIPKYTCLPEKSTV